MHSIRLLTFYTAMLSKRYDFNDCLLAAASEAASDSSGEQQIDEVISDLSFVDSAVEAVVGYS